jgi:hydrogenase-4 component E
MTLFQFLLALVFLTVVFSHITKKNSGAIILYAIQSLAVACLVFVFYLETHNIYSLLIAVLILLAKVIAAPAFIFRLVKKEDLKFSTSTFVNTPLTLLVVAGLTTVAHLPVFLPLTSIIPANHELLSIALSALFVSLFLIVNRKGAISQIVGILSFENMIVVFALFAGLEQSPGLQAGILFDICIWVVIATIFISHIYKHFGTLDVTEMQKLKD